MKNVKACQLKKCIFLTVEEYEEVLSQIFETRVTVHADLDGIWYDADKNDTDVNCDDNLHVLLADHFCVSEVTSVHADDCDYVGIWICYKE